MKIKIFILAVLTFLSSSAIGGWIITQRTYDSDEGVEKAYVEKIFMEDYRMKFENPEMSTVFNLETGELFIIDEGKKLYWSGTVKDFKEELKESIKLAFEKQLKTVPKEQKAMMEQMYKSMLQGLDNSGQINEVQQLDIIIEDNNMKEKILDYNSSKYSVIVNGVLREELWVAREYGMRKDFDIEKFYSLFDEFLNQGYGNDNYQMHTDYIQLMQKGYPMKTITFYGGYKTITEVTDVEKVTLGEEAFLPPSEYTKSNLDEMGLNSSIN